AQCSVREGGRRGEAACAGLRTGVHVSVLWGGHTCARNVYLGAVEGARGAYACVMLDAFRLARPRCSFHLLAVQVGEEEDTIQRFIISFFPSVLFSLKKKEPSHGNSVMKTFPVS
ncbi:unnamed protein product, partial [Discosporangium mesarthrocarpum]